MKKTVTLSLLACSVAALFSLYGFKTDSKKLAEGDMAPEICMPNPNGDTLKLSSLKGHMVLVHFWASWCVHCRAESKDIVDLSHKYYDKKFKTGKGLIILYVSVDEDKKAWVKAIHQDELSMKYNVSDLKGWKNFAAQAYNVSALPNNFLVDGNGKIIAQSQQQVNLLAEELNQQTIK